jgi:hypothetical protein
MTFVDGKTFTVSFEVDRKVEHPFGYLEVYLRCNGEKCPYKAIVKDGKLMAIVKRGYKLIPHELVEKYILSVEGLRIARKEDYGSRVYWEIEVENDKEVKLMIINSVDGSHALMAQIIFVVDNVKILIPRVKSKKVASEIKKVHKKSAKVEELPIVIMETLKASKGIKDMVFKAFDQPAAGFKEVWDMVVELIPEKYTRVIMARLYGAKEPLTVGDVYKDMIRKIWASDTDMRTKLTFIGHMNDALWIISDAAGVVDG